MMKHAIGLFVKGQILNTHRGKISTELKLKTNKKSIGEIALA